jgi:nucleotide-binding universal stress UspA family protein
MRHFHPNKILIPTDFSSVADHAFVTAQRLATRFGSELIVVHCGQGIPFAFDYPVEAAINACAVGDANLLERLQQYADERLADGDVPYRVKLMIDGPVSGIARAAEELDADLIVLGTHGRTGWQRALLGSVTEGLMRLTSRPVLTVRDELPASFTRILCPVNHSAASRNALEYAASLTLALKGELLVVHVLEMGQRILIDEQPPLREWVPQEVRDRCRYAEFLGRNNPAEEIISFAERHDVSFIVLGAQHKRFRDESVVGATSEHVVRHATRPVLTIVSPLSPEVLELAPMEVTEFAKL